jgi:hypothetical protein
LINFSTIFSGKKGTWEGLLIISIFGVLSLVVVVDYSKEGNTSILSRLTRDV